MILRKTGMVFLCYAALACSATAQTRWNVPENFNVTRLCNAIDSYIGTPYRYGGTSRNGMDCSGFVMTVFNNAGARLPHSSAILVTLGEEVSRDQLRPGDLVFFSIAGKSVSHVGVMRRDGVFAHASTSSGVRLDQLTNPYWAGAYTTARRLVPSRSRQNNNGGAAQEEYGKDTGAEEEVWSNEGSDTGKDK